MTRLLGVFTVIMFCLWVIILGLVQGLMYQPRWNVVLFRYEWTNNLTLQQRDQERTWMIDVNTGMRRDLPFRYFAPLGVDVSEDGKRILVVISGKNSEGRADGGELYIIKRDDLNNPSPSALTASPGYDGEPDTTDDLRRIVFVSDRNGKRDLYVMLLDLQDRPTSISQVTHDDLVEQEPQWLTREQYHDYLDQFSRGEDPVILNPG
jgi:hypothetical protein